VCRASSTTLVEVFPRVGLEPSLAEEGTALVPDPDPAGVVDIVGHADLASVPFRQLAAEVGMPEQAHLAPDHGADLLGHEFIQPFHRGLRRPSLGQMGIPALGGGGMPRFPAIRVRDPAQAAVGAAVVVVHDRPGEGQEGIPRDQGLGTFHIPRVLVDDLLGLPVHVLA